ncbi:MAG: cell division protein ZapE, partial [Pseudomonadota bacterium]|nr:cell division protein ZapE [Pseudomonadota bacterium]
MTPSQRYAVDLQQSEFQDDPAQRQAVRELDRLHSDLTAATGQPDRRSRGWLRRLFSTEQPQAAPEGLYLWGDVGRGKSYLMDLLFDTLPVAQKRREHFHAFMQMVHRRLRELKDRTDPVAELADALAADLRLLCFDELQVQDVADAMILGPLLSGMMQAGVTIVCTSNTAPRDLYRGGLQRERFL